MRTAALRINVAVSVVTTRTPRREILLAEMPASGVARNALPPGGQETPTQSVRLSTRGTLRWVTPHTLRSLAPRDEADRGTWVLRRAARDARGRAWLPLVWRKCHRHNCRYLDGLQLNGIGASKVVKKTVRKTIVTVPTAAVTGVGLRWMYSCLFGACRQAVSEWLSVASPVSTRGG